jgi:hypothetical protein
MVLVPGVSNNNGCPSHKLQQKKTHNKITISRMISGFCPSANDICTLLGYYTALIGN